MADMVHYGIYLKAECTSAVAVHGHFIELVNYKLQEACQA